MDFELGYIYADSRQAKENDIFCIYNSFGEKTIQYIQEAISHGVKTVCIYGSSPYLEQSKNFPNVLLCSTDPAEAHGFIASYMKGEPSLQLKIIAITGTNGKTSMTYILGDLASRNGFQIGIIGTIRVVYGNKRISTGYTTPDPSSLNSILKEMLDAGIEYVFMEASSHGLKLGRMNGIHLQGAVFTNLTRDHLDFHESMEDYFASKYKLFELLSQSAHPSLFAVINTDSKWGKDILSNIKKDKLKVKAISLGKGGDFELETKELSLTGTKFTIAPKGSALIEATTNLLGNFNSFNVTIAYITALQMNIESELLLDSIKSLHPVDGRFQIIYNRKRNRLAIVDYAHTPDALENVLKSLQEIPHSRLICLFGCGGDRDQTKRPIMAEIAAKYSDMVIITSDNPRNEDPEKILNDIQSGFPPAYKSVLRISSRRQAIKKGIEILPENGFLLVAGKGHENYQIIGNSKENFSDTIEIQSAFIEDESSRK